MTQMNQTTPPSALPPPWKEDEIQKMIEDDNVLLPYPLKPLKMAVGPDIEEYVIPDEDKEQVLQELYPFMDCPKLSATRYDLHADKNFRVRGLKVVREGGMNLLVSPYYAEEGGTVIDWMPAQRNRHRTSIQGDC